MLPRLPLAARLALVAVAGLLAYSNSFGVPFQFDDTAFLLTPPSSDLASFLASPGGPARIVGTFTFALNGSAHGPAVAGYHVVNLAIHVATAVCVYFLTALACRTVEPTSPALRAGAAVAGIVAALLFVTHPVQTQAVTYVIQRFTSLAALLYVGAVLAYAHAVLAPPGLRKAALFASTGVLALLALFTKQHAVTLPAALAVVDLAILPGTARRRIARLAPYFALLGIAAVTSLGATSGVEVASAEFRERRAEEGLPLWLSYVLTQPTAVLTYLRLLVFPAGQNLDYDQALVSSVVSAEALVPAAALAIVLGVPAILAWRARARSATARLVLLAVGWLVVTLSVECVIPLADVVVEHRVYLPSVGLFLALAAGGVTLASRLSSHGRAAAAAVAAALVVALGVATWARNAVWVDVRTLWNDAASKSPRKARPLVYLAQDLLNRGDPAGAIEVLNRAAALPTVPLHVNLNLAVAHARLGDRAKAEILFRGALARGAANIGAHRGLAHLLVDSGRTAEACTHVTAALRYSPHDRAMREYDGNCRFERGDVAGAAQAWSSLAAVGSPEPRVLFNLAVAHAALGDAGSARAAYQRFLAVAGPDLEPQRRAAMNWLSTQGATR